MNNKRIFAVHLLNDYSGSPLVFSQALEALQQEHEVHLLTATPNGRGFLSNIHVASTTSFFYKWHSNKVITLLYFLWSQWQLFFKLSLKLKKEDTVYVNTLLPFGAAMAGYLKGSKVVYHIHEVSIKPVILKKFLIWITEQTATKIVFVSNYVSQQFNFKKPELTIIHNALPKKFVQKAASIEKLNTNAPFTVLMLCSLKTYKGIHEFVDVARQLPNLQFQLVLNATEEAAVSFGKQVLPPNNCHLFPAQQDTMPFYEKAHLVLNLSRPDEWVETFGMTILEAMHCGRPVIVPPVGGPCELVEDGQEGFHINSSNIQMLSKCINSISSDFSFYKKLSQAAQFKAAAFDTGCFDNAIKQLFVNGNVQEMESTMETVSTKRKKKIA